MTSSCRYLPKGWRPPPGLAGLCIAACGTWGVACRSDAFPPQPATAETSAAKSKEDRLSQDVTRVVLRFLDRSVPPRYHRSYTVTVEPEQVRTSVDVYGEVIAQTSSPMSSSEWLALVQYATELGPGPAPPEEPGRVGGSLYFLTVWRGTDSDELSWAPEDTPSTPIPVRVALARKIEGLVPSLKDLRDTTPP
jgi:hypothetical protein